MRAGNTTPNGGVYIEMAHLGPEEVARRFKGMVTRCADCGFDLAGGRVEVVPTVNYMMGGVEFELDCGTAMSGLFAAGEDCGGVHGANRLGGNGVANSTVFGGIAGDSMAAYVRAEGALKDPDMATVDEEIGRAELPFAHGSTGFTDLRDRLWHTMWDEVGILRDAAGLTRALETLDGYEAELMRAGLPDGDRAFNLTWQDWLNLRSQIEISRVITTASPKIAGAPISEDFLEAGDLDSTTFTRVTGAEGANPSVEMVPVDFSIVAPVNR